MQGLWAKRSFCCMGDSATDQRCSGLLGWACGFCALAAEPVSPPGYTFLSGALCPQPDGGPSPRSCHAHPYQTVLKPSLGDCQAQMHTMSPATENPHSPGIYPRPLLCSSHSHCLDSLPSFLPSSPPSPYSNFSLSLKIQLGSQLLQVAFPDFVPLPPVPPT